MVINDTERIGRFFVLTWNEDRKKKRESNGKQVFLSVCFDSLIFLFYLYIFCFFLIMR